VSLGDFQPLSTGCGRLEPRRKRRFTKDFALDYVL
jgi:hypothetical protein